MGLFQFIKEMKLIKEELDKAVLEHQNLEKAYLNMSNDELRILSDDELYHAVIIRLETKVDNYEDIDAGIESLIEEQKVPYVLNYFEIEVNNGGLCQFFVNSSRICAPYISDYLEIIGAKDHKDIFDKFINENNINVYDLSSFIIKRTKDYNKQFVRYPFDDFDNQFYELESFEEKLIQYIRKNIDKY